jgi:hypothetical protein
MPLTVSAYLKKFTGIRGKHYRGSMKLYPLGESQTTLLTDDELNTGALTVFGALAAAVVGGFTDPDANVWFPVLFSRQLSTYRTNPTSLVTTPILSISVRKTLGVMRHRRVKSVY